MGNSVGLDPTRNIRNILKGGMKAKSFKKDINNVFFARESSGYDNITSGGNL